MKIAVMGAGGIGGYYGGRLAKSGEEVTFIARGPHLEALRTGGLRVESPHGDIHLPSVQATNDPAEVGVVDLVLMTTKAYDLEGAAHAIRPMVGPGTRVLPLLNGVDIVDRLSTVLSPAAVLGGYCMISAAIAEPGLIRHVGAMEKVSFGEMDGSVTDSLTDIGKAFAASGVNYLATTKIELELWQKFIILAPIAGVCCLTRSLKGPVMDDPDTLALLKEALGEVEAVGRARGIPYPADIAAITLGILQGMPYEMKPSMLLDLERRKAMELEALNGAVVRMGKEAGVPTPVNAMIYTALKLHANGAPA